MSSGNRAIEHSRAVLSRARRLKTDKSLILLVEGVVGGGGAVDQFGDLSFVVEGHTHPPHFEAELDCWHHDTGTWPAERTYPVFRKWFEVRFYPLIQDLVGEELTATEVEEEFIGELRPPMKGLAPHRLALVTISLVGKVHRLMLHHHGPRRI